MRVLWIGFGQAGGKLANTMMEVDRKLYSAIAINTEQADLVGLDHIREKVLIGRYILKGRGVGADSQAVHFKPCLVRMLLIVGDSIRRTGYPHGVPVPVLKSTLTAGLINPRIMGTGVSARPPPV